MVVAHPSALRLGRHGRFGGDLRKTFRTRCRPRLTDL